MLYMLAFNKKEDIILYWDEPTMTLDYDSHPIHQTIQKNWRDNLIPNVVLSSATLPRKEEIMETIDDFRETFPEAQIAEITNYDCKKSIQLINREGYVELPHYLYSEYSDVLVSVKHCIQNKTLIRYFDLTGVLEFIGWVEQNAEMLLVNNRYRISSIIENVEDITMSNIKMLYVNMLGNIIPEKWNKFHSGFCKLRVKKHQSVINLATTDSHTLTDGPTLFIANDISKIAQYYIQSANIPKQVYEALINKMQENKKTNKKIEELETEITEILNAKDNSDKSSSEDSASKTTKKKSTSSSKPVKSESVNLKQDTVNDLRLRIHSIILDPVYTPNTVDHLHKYAPRTAVAGESLQTSANNIQALSVPFTQSISEDVVEEIMNIIDIDESWKLLLLMGIGVFAIHKSVKYTEIIKRLTQEQKLFAIFATSDFIYGTNYQLCHGYIGMDLMNMSQEKCIQSMGRVGRNKIQQTYSIRFRDNYLLYKLFKPDDKKPEVYNMNKLFVH